MIIIKKKKTTVFQSSVVFKQLDGNVTLMIILASLRKIINGINNRYRVRVYKVSISHSAELNGIVYFSCNKGNSIRIGENTIINSGKLYNQIGGDVRCVIRTVDDGKIIIGNNVGISNSAIVSREKIIIEDNVMIGGACKIYDNDFHSLDYSQRVMKPDIYVKKERVLICEGAFIGAHSIILKGVRVGKYSVIGAGSVVTKDVPDGEIWAGNPAVFIRKVDG